MIHEETNRCDAGAIQGLQTTIRAPNAYKGEEKILLAIGQGEQAMQILFHSTYGGAYGHKSQT